jgi:glycosyltransferase involved in cell wall biosynthesis
MSVSLNPRAILMLCHDQHLDRRVVAQAKSLISIGHKVTLVALSFDQEGSREVTPEGIDLVRIGLANIEPENPQYRGYLLRQHRLNTILNWFSNRIPHLRSVFCLTLRIASKVNIQCYRVMLLLVYRNRYLHDPLPFRSAFVNATNSLEGDVIQVHDLPALEAGVEIATQRKIPLVYDAHELYPEQKSFSAVQRRICSTAESGLIRRADLVFAVNQSIGREMAARYSIDMPKVLLNAIDPPAGFDPSLKYDVLREKLGLSKDRRLLLFQGGFAPNRNLENLVAAFSKVANPDVDLIMMGFGPFGDTLRAIAGKHGLLDKRVFFLPEVPQSELLQHSASADMGIIPYPHIDLNSYYCTPNKLFEFIQAGLPILANDSPELRRFVGIEGFGLSHEMRSPRQISKAIDMAFRELPFAEWRQQLRFKRHVYRWDVQEKEYLTAMQEFLNASDQKLSEGGLIMKKS